MKPRRSYDATEAARHTAPADDLPLFGAPADEPKRERPAFHEPRPEPLSLDEQFAAFHREHPHVYAEIERRAVALHRLGRTRVGIKAIVEAMRYDYAIANQGTDYKLNNNLASRYARLVVERRPELDAVIEMRGLRSA